MPQSVAWDASDIPELTGRTALVTGATSGIGLETALELAAHGATVVLGCRSPERGGAAVERITAAVPSAEVEVLDVDLASLASVRDAAASFSRSHGRLDLLVNNAGVMATPEMTSAEGFELQFATNHLGHFALTGLLLGPLMTTPGARVVTVTSLMHRLGLLSREDPAHPTRYRRWLAYGNSKLANLLFTHELERRLEQARVDTIAVAAHPGWVRTGLVAKGWLLDRPPELQRVGRLLTGHLGRPARTGALPVLRAATGDGVRGGECYGPGGPFQLSGPPTRVGASPASHRRELAGELWGESEQLTGVHYRFEHPTAA